MGKNEELLDIYDENMNYIGTQKRSLVHKNGYWHKTFQCWIYFYENAKAYLLFQLRHPEKDTFPNHFDISSAGHLIAGEKIEDGLRELKEELGIEVALHDLTYVGIIKRSIATKYHTDNEFCCVYLYKSNRPINSYTFQKEEVTGLFKVDAQEFHKLILRRITNIEAIGMEVFEDGILHEVKRLLSIEDFVPHGNEYYEKVIQALANE